MKQNLWLRTLIGIGAHFCATAAVPVQQSYLKASNPESSDKFGYSVAVSGDTMVLGAIHEDSASPGINGDQTNNSAANSGAAYIFVRNGTNWNQQAYLKPSNPNADDEFGYSVAVSGNTVVVGTRKEASNATGVNGNSLDNSAPRAGAAYVFIRNGTNWSQQAYLKASNTEAYDAFGYSVAISGDTIVVGARQEASSATGVNGDQPDNGAPGSGAAYVFVRTGTNWSQQAYCKASNTDTNDQFGWSVGISENTMIIAAFNEDSISTGINGDQTNNGATNSGAAYIFVRDGTDWTQQAYLKSSNSETGDMFGQAVSISGETAVVTAHRKDSGAGAAYVFVRDGTNWIQQAQLKASNAEGGPLSQGDWFGFSVAISGEAVVVGAIFEDSAATGVNGDEFDNSAPSAGAAYLFVRTGTNWNQQAYIKASNTALGDGFASSVAIAEDFIAIGAPQKDSVAGAAYPFALERTSENQPKLAIIPDGIGGYFLRMNAPPSLPCSLQRSMNLTSHWTTLDTRTVPPSGVIEFHDASPPLNQAFYRVVRQQDEASWMQR